MRISEAYFQQLLWDTEPVEAVHILASCWAARADEGRQHFGLRLPEYRAQLYLIVSGEVSNGGLHQYLLNRGGALLDDTVSALAAMGLENAAAALGRIPAMFSAGTVPKLASEAAAQMSRLSLNEQKQLDDADDALFHSLTGAERGVLAFLRKHSDQLLLDERAEH